MNVTLRAGRPEDAQRCGVICYEAFKRISEHHNFPQDFPSPEPATELLTMLLSRGDVYSVVAEVNGQIAGDSLLLKPLAGVAFVRPRASGELGRGRGATFMQGSVESELVADVDAEDLHGVDERRE